MYIAFNNIGNCNQTFLNNNLTHFNHTYELNNSINEDIHFKNQSKKKNIKFNSFKAKKLNHLI